MNKISANSIQMFVAGALALMGFHALIWIPYYLFVSKNGFLVFGALVSGLALLIGIAILRGRTQAVWWGQFYLCFSIVLVVATTAYIHFFKPEATVPNRWRTATDLLIPFILLGLLTWSRSKRFRDKPDI